MEHSLSGIKIDKSIPVPLYYQLKKQLLALIQDATLKEGDMLPPENELCERLGISRPTVRQAFGELVNEGYLNRYKGRGTFVAAPKINERFLSRLESFDREMERTGKRPGTQVLALEQIPAYTKANEKLAVDLEAPLIHLSRLRFADDVPLVFVDTYLPYERFRDMLGIDFVSTSLYDALDSVCGVKVQRVSREIEAVNARRKEAELLGISQNKALFLVETLAYAPDIQEPVEFSVARYRGDLNKFSVEIVR